MAKKDNTGRAFEAPKIPSAPKVVHIYDIIALVIFVCAFFVLFPLDLGSGIDDNSLRSPAEITKHIEKFYVDAEPLQSILQNGNIYSGGYMLNGEPYFRYIEKDGSAKYVTFSYSKGGKKLSSHRIDRTGIIVNGILMSLNNNGNLYIDKLGQKFQGEADLDWKSYVSDSEGFDYKKICSMIAGNTSRSIRMSDAAVINALISENVLIGYDGSAVWFTKKKSDGKSILLRGTTDTTEEIMSLDSLGKVMVAGGKYMITNTDGTLTVTDIADKSHKIIEILNENGIPEPILGFTFSIKKERVRVHAYTESTLYSFYADNEADNPSKTFYPTDKQHTSAARGISCIGSFIWLYFGEDNYERYDAYPAS